MEEGFTNQLAGALIAFLLPPDEVALPIVQTLLRELIAKFALRLTVDMLSDPDYINQYILYYCDQLESVS